MRYQALKELRHAEADCLVSKEDESHTYNARVSRLNPIQEHKMIMKAVQNGVRPERIAAALNLPLVSVQATIDLLKDKGICREGPPDVEACHADPVDRDR